MKKSNSVGFEAIAQEDTFQSLNVEKNAESPIKKRGRPRKTPLAEEPIIKQDSSSFGFAAAGQITNRIIDDDEIPHISTKKSQKI